MNETFSQKKIFLVVLFSMFILDLSSVWSSNLQKFSKVLIEMELLKPANVRVEGFLGINIDASRDGRLKTFITGPKSLPVSIFDRDSVAKTVNLNRRPDGEDYFVGGGWLGEHVGKWLIAAARAANRTKDTQLIETVIKVAGYLIEVQEADGYLGTYAPSVRMTAPGPYPERTWDVWVHSYLMLAFLELYQYWPDDRYLNVVRKIGDLCIKTFGKNGIKSLAYMGNHVGLSGTILLEPVIELYKTTGEQKYLSLAEHIIKQIEERPGLEIVSRSLAGYDLEEIGDGKIYQLNWNYVGIAKLYEVTCNEDYLKAVLHAWQNIKDHHLTLAGGPWGGVGRHAECFNKKGYFNPYGFIETCNTMSWIQLNKQLLRLSGEAQYAEEIEVSIYNSLLGAQYPNGQDWCYFIFPNGRRHKAIWRDCCKSSGALALEEIAPAIYGRMGHGVSINIYAPSQGSIRIASGQTITITQNTNYPFDEEVKLTVTTNRDEKFPIYVRIPNWSENTKIYIDGASVTEQVQSGSFLPVERKWKSGDEIQLRFPMKIKIRQQHQKYDHRNQEVYRIDYFGITRGPLVYATGLIDGNKVEDTFILKKKDPEKFFSIAATPQGYIGPAIQLQIPERMPLLYLPYYEAGGRAEGSWRLTWIPVIWEP